MPPLETDRATSAILGVESRTMRVTALLIARVTPQGRALHGLFLLIDL